MFIDKVSRERLLIEVSTCNTLLTAVYFFRSSNGHVAIVMAVCYFSKWIEARPLKSKEAVEVARFLYEDIICHHGCVAIQINDQGREFVNSVSAELHTLTGTTQRITSAYHPQVSIYPSSK